MLGGVMTVTGWHTAFDQDGACSAPTQAPPSEAQLYTTQTDISLNGTLCLGLKPTSLLAEDRKALAARTADRETAQKQVDKAADALKLAEGTKNAADLKPEDKAKADRDFKTADDALKAAQTDLATKDTALSKLPTKRSLYLLIDGVQAPARPIDLQISPASSEQTDANAYIWRSIKLTSNSDAASDDGKAWRNILSGPTNGGVRKVRIRLSDTGTQPPTISADLVGKEKDQKLVVFEPCLVAIGSIGLLVLAGGLMMMGWNGGMLRDRTPDISTDPNIPDPDPSPTFSLARVQFMWWMFLTIGGFLFSWLTIGQFSGVVTSGVLTLLGISGLTGLSARVVDDLPAGAAPSLQQSQGFWTDILSDGTGAQSIALHRVQLVAWNIILGIIFLWTTLTSFLFPAFDQSLLILAGIVNATYVGFKFPENK